LLLLLLLLQFFAMILTKRNVLPFSSKPQVATKFAALPFRTKASDVVKACEKSVARLGTGRPIDLYQIHFPNAWSNAEYWDGLAMAYEKGLVKAVGVSNYGIDAVRACHDALAKRGIPLASNQIQLSLLYTHPIDNGLLKACDDLGVKGSTQEFISKSSSDARL
jgi:pyridoxine 4-dehydrogenase